MIISAVVVGTGVVGGVDVGDSVDVGAGVGAAHRPLFPLLPLLSHAPLTQSRLCLQFLPVPHWPQSPPPQSTPVSLPFFRASLHEASVGRDVGVGVGCLVVGHGVGLIPNGGRVQGERVQGVGFLVGLQQTMLLLCLCRHLMPLMQ